ncbi:glycosyl transferase family 25 protein [Metarhizium robertsii]|uniref:Glycosyl transferase, family 25 n=2 Tax=Metarhizium robertsii TaxID=568076 RepID=E9EKA2_METRA|nr:Glycosyl transferase, family 25 [Metarhizium robertsii ARSEF 23]EFZ03843.1 Glycosyl transferase, family 25 [Metarhizium robertsii ARSEF 23]EXU94810.1 glycosyl transferase family 25 protein [Metarhizium robertsii]
MRFILRRHAQWLVLAAALLLTSLFFLKSEYLAHKTATSANLMAWHKLRESSELGEVAQKAGNSTLGFGSIYFINMKKRYDRLDAVSLQAYLSGVDVMPYSAVEPEMINDVGMPPTRVSLKEGEKGCWRAHANIWSAILRGKLPPVLILESDAAWDINLRKIMPNLNKHFRQFLFNISSARIPNPGWNANFDESISWERKEATDDPWLSDHWDLLSLGQCHETSENSNVSSIYHDPTVPPGKDYFGRVLGRERVIRQAGGIVCTTAYAISQTGAAKLLLNTAVKLDAPVDLVIREMILSGELVAYSVMPPIIAQWQYKPDIGMDQRGANSDINGPQGEQQSTKDPWPEVEQSGSVWITKPSHPDVAFEAMALNVAWQRIFGEKREKSNK